MTVKFFPGIISPVAFVSVAQCLELDSKKTITALLMGGGFLCSMMSEEALTACRELPFLDDAGREELQNISAGPLINVSIDVADTLTESELYAMLSHEDAHCLNGDLLPTEQTKSRVFNGIELLDSQAAELTADAHAIRQMGKEAMRSGLIKSVEASAAVIEQYRGKEDAQKYRTAIYSNAEFLERLSAIDAA